MHRDVSNARVLRGKRELPHHTQQARHHLRLTEAGEPETEIESIGHGQECIDVKQRIALPESYNSKRRDRVPPERRSAQNPPIICQERSDGICHREDAEDTTAAKDEFSPKTQKKS